MTLNPSVKYHLFIGLGAGIWITLFLVFVGPFDIAGLSIIWRAQVMYVYGLIFFVAYAATIPLQNQIYRYAKSWGPVPESFIFFVAFSLSLCGSYYYYHSEVIRGDYSFYGFLWKIFLPTILIFTPLLAIARWYVNRLPVTEKGPQEKPLEAEDLHLENWVPAIEKIMEDRVYLNPNLTLKDMAKLLDTNSSILSKVINQGYGRNFNDFINEYRIEAVLQALHQGQHATHTLSGIAHNCGFNSKATFNRAFKKYLQLSPSDYIRQLEEKGP